MIMIAFITIKSGLVPLIEGLCAQILYLDWKLSVVCAHIFLLCLAKFNHRLHSCFSARVQHQPRSCLWRLTVTITQRQPETLRRLHRTVALHRVHWTATRSSGAPQSTRLRHEISGVEHRSLPDCSMISLSLLEALCARILFFRFVNIGFSLIFFFPSSVCAKPLSLTRAFLLPLSTGSCVWLSPFLLCADHTCVLVCVCLCMCMWKCVYWSSVKW